MDSNGAVVCFQKYALGNGIEKESGATKSAVCLGYFGRVEVKEVNSFKDYVRIASQHGAEQACSRKQLLLHRIDKIYDEDITISSEEYRLNGGLPFWHSEKNKSSICCCTALNITAGVLNENVYLSNVADWLFAELKKVKDLAKENFHFAITGLLGAEDLCIIILANRYDIISKAMQVLQQLTTPDKSQYVVDNCHSILMLDTTDSTAVDVAGWADTYAEIHFSLKSVAGRSYLLKVTEALKNKVSESLQDTIKLEGQTGEYDAFIKCPAFLLDKDLYGDNGLISYNNMAYRKIAYQSETIVYPFGCEENSLQPLDSYIEDSTSDRLSEKVEKAINEIKVCFLGSSSIEDNDFDYIELAIYRLLKDYRRMAAFPYNNDLRKDFAEQFMVAVNAIVEAAHKYKEPDPTQNVSLFNQTFDEIANSLSQSMQAASQFDRLNFDEQPLYLQNIGSYHKVLRCYYGIIKDILQLLYSIERKPSSGQAIIIPLLSFGLTPIVISKNYDSKIDIDGLERKARLVSIKLPYQAIANPPKYLGILVHELFHYAAPSNREKRNEIIINYLTRVALLEFLKVLATSQRLGYGKHYGVKFYNSRKSLCKFASEKWANDILTSDFIKTARSEELSAELPNYFNLQRESGSITYTYYFTIWKNLRKQLLASSTWTDDERKIFALELEDNEDATAIAKAFAKRIRNIDSCELDSFYKLMSDCFRAIGELPPDIFDVSFVLHGEKPNEKLNQYLWQIHGTQRDLLAGAIPNPQVEDVPRAYLGITTLRIGYFINYCLDQLNQPCTSETLRTYLSAWGDSAEKFKKIKQQFIHDYSVFTDFSEFFSDVALKLSDSVSDEIKNLTRTPECVAIMNKLTGFYKQYFNLLDKLQRKTIPVDQFTNDMFAICCSLVDTYQNQSTIRDTSKILLACENLSITKEELPKESDHYSSQSYEETAEDSASLSMAIHKACRAMSCGFELPILWYRGQTNKNWKTLPNIMRGARIEHNKFLYTLQNELRWARAKILPIGNDFSQADWLAFLQHNGFKTSVLDFSESLYPALFFATEKWGKDTANPPKVDASITMFNPVLFNLAMNLLDSDTKENYEELKHYLDTGVQRSASEVQPPLFADGEDLDDYQMYFDWTVADNKLPYRPRAALIPKNCDRMKKQSGQFVFFDLNSDSKVDLSGNRNYSHWSLESLHQEYLERLKRQGVEVPMPFLFKININHLAYRDFKDYLQAIGMGEYQVYPEFDKLAEDIKRQLGLN